MGGAGGRRVEKDCLAAIAADDGRILARSISGRRSGVVKKRSGGGARAVMKFDAGPQAAVACAAIGDKFRAAGGGAVIEVDRAARWAKEYSRSGRVGEKSRQTAQSVIGDVASGQRTVVERQFAAVDARVIFAGQWMEAALINHEALHVGRCIGHARPVEGEICLVKGR